MIRSAGMRPALALKPKTLIDHTLIEIFDKKLFDMILIMTVGIDINKLKNLDSVDKNL